MKINTKLLIENFAQETSAELVPTEEVNLYLLEHVICPLLRGEKVRYGDIDYDRFEDIDLRMASGYCDELSHIEYELEQLIQGIVNIEPSADRTRGYC